MGSGGEGGGLIELVKAKGGGNPLKCIQCGSCTSACIVNALNEVFNPRMIVGSIARFNRFPNQNLWLCSTCCVCVDRCPQGVNPFSIITALRRISYERGEAPRKVIEMVETIKRTGLAFPLNEDIEKRRRLLGLPEIQINEDCLNEIRRIIEEAGFK